MNLKMKTSRLAVVAGLSLAVALGGTAAIEPAAAYAEGSSYTMTVNKATDGTYNLYQIFTADVVAGTGDGEQPQLGNASLNQNLKSYVTAAYKDATGTDISNESDSAIIGFIHQRTDDQAKTFANKLAKRLMESTDASLVTATATASDETVSFGAQPSGYYLIAQKDATDPADKNAMTSGILVPLTANKQLTAKVTTPTVDKQVKDDTGNGWDKDFSDIADAGLLDGKIDQLTYKITGTVASNIADYDTYYYKVTDVLPKGLDVTKEELDSKWGVSIKVDGKDVTSSFTSAVSEANTGKDDVTDTVTWETVDLKKVMTDAGVKDLANAKVTVEYTPVYDTNDVNRMYKNAGSLSTPDVNTASIEFSNNPYTGGHGGHTPGHETKVYDYNLKIFKKDAAGKALKGAKFTLTDASGKTVGKDVTANDDGTFEFHGLEADVEYTITESKTPTGFKTIQPIKFKINATKADDGQTVTKIVASEVSDPSAAADLTADGDATINANVVNIPDHDYPNTGAAGIYGGIAVGGIIIAVSAAALVRRRQNSENA